MARVQELVDLLAEAESIVIVCHDNPDPDCLASSLALRTIAGTCGVTERTIVYRGTISNRHGQAIVNGFDVELTALDGYEFRPDDLVAFVDHHGSLTRVDLPPGTSPDVVIDHHPAPHPIAATYLDLREVVGATSTILTEYVRELDVDVSTELASTLLFALHNERIDQMHRPTVHEYEAAAYLFPMASLELLSDIYSAPFSPAVMDAIGTAIANREVRGSTLVSGVDAVRERGALSQAVDLLLLLEGVSTVLVFGVRGDVLHLSARSVDPRVNTVEVLTGAFGTVGTVGGDQSRATGRIPLGLFGERTDDGDLVAILSAAVSDRFFETMQLEAS